MSNPILLRPLNTPDPSTFYTFIAKGYNDYPKM
jgi:N-ethylmaleimide reductase